MYASMSNRGHCSLGDSVKTHESNGKYDVDCHLGVAYLSFSLAEARELAERLTAVANEAEVAQHAADAARAAIEASRITTPALVPVGHEDYPEEGLL